MERVETSGDGPTINCSGRRSGDVPRSVGHAVTAAGMRRITLTAWSPSRS
jgi:hypothetical protein